MLSVAIAHIHGLHLLVERKFDSIEREFSQNHRIVSRIQAPQQEPNTEVWTSAGSALRQRRLRANQRSWHNRARVSASESTKRTSYAPENSSLLKLLDGFERNTHGTTC